MCIVQAISIPNPILSTHRYQQWVFNIVKTNWIITNITMCKIIPQNSSTTFFTSHPEMLTICPSTFYVPNFHISCTQCYTNRTLRIQKISWAITIIKVFIVINQLSFITTLTSGPVILSQYFEFQISILPIHAHKIIITLERSLIKLPQQLKSLNGKNPLNESWTNTLRLQVLHLIQKYFPLSEEIKTLFGHKLFFDIIFIHIIMHTKF